MSDHEAWMELADLYLAEQDYNKAAFCVEELILFNPHNHLYHQRYAEVSYSLFIILSIDDVKSELASAFVSDFFIFLV